MCENQTATIYSKFAYLEARIGLLESGDAIVESNFAVFRLIVALKRAQLALLEPAKGEDDVSAQISWNVLGQEFSNFHTILRPVGVIADNLVAIFVNFAAAAALFGHLHVGGRRCCEASRPLSCLEAIGAGRWREIDAILSLHHRGG